MKILALNYKTGELQFLEVPVPVRKGNTILVKTMASLVSIGTERAMIDIAKKSLLGKALARPDWVKQVIDKIKTEGFMEAWRQSQARLDTPVPLGYSCAGIVVEVDTNEGDFRIGDRVACSGSGYASHAEFNVVPKNLCVKIPDNLSFEDASYVALGGIAMEAIRLAKIEFGYNVGVIGLGLLGQLAVQILKTAGCHVLGVDLLSEKCKLALVHGAEAVALVGKDNPVALAREFTKGEGLDAVIIFASTPSNEPLEQAAEMCRERGRIIACGLIGLNIPREIFYKKELDFAVSRAWGPGLYDPDYEERNLKYPFPYVRWTAKSNMEEFLKMLSSGNVKVEKLTTHKFPFEKALDAYNMVLSKKEETIGVVLTYGEKSKIKKEELKVLNNNLRGRKTKEKGIIGIGLIGAGLFAKGTLLPAMKKIERISLEGVATASGLSAQHIMEKFGFKYCTTDYHEILADENVDIVFILTRHNTHSKFICEALKAGKKVFVEKPLCINKEELKEIIETYYSLIDDSGFPFLMIGFNRRFAPTTQKCIDFIGQNRNSCVINIRCNAGYIPPDSWVHKKEEGGGRIIGEVCHFVDLVQAITNSFPKRVFAVATPDPKALNDNLTISLEMENGSVASIVYVSCGDKSFSRERVEVFSGGSVCIIDNFKNITFVSSGKKKIEKSLEVDRGHINELKLTIDAIRNGKPSPIEFKSIIATTITTFAIEKSIIIGQPIKIDLNEWIS
jgi:predicted dehydrogenase/threonine dehydrogenase-like Zn-dependent dehydrogenase